MLYIYLIIINILFVSELITKDISIHITDITGLTGTTWLF